MLTRCQPSYTLLVRRHTYVAPPWCRRGEPPPTSGVFLWCSDRTSWRYLNATDTLTSPLTHTAGPPELILYPEPRHRRTPSRIFTRLSHRVRHSDNPKRGQLLHPACCRETSRKALLPRVIIAFPHSVVNLVRFGPSLRLHLGVATCSAMHPPQLLYSPVAYALEHSLMGRPRPYCPACRSCASLLANGWRTSSPISVASPPCVG